MSLFWNDYQHCNNDNVRANSYIASHGTIPRNNMNLIYNKFLK